MQKVFHQIIVLDENLKLIKSNDTLFSTDYLKRIPVEKWFPFIESIYDTLKQLEVSDGEIQFLRIESPAAFLPGSYDFSFSKSILDNQKYILWDVYDYTDVYVLLSKYQQLKNERDIARQQLELQQRQSAHLDDLFSG